MRILFVADGRSPTTRSWLEPWLEGGHQVHLVSTFPCPPLPGLASFTVIPVAFGGLAGGAGGQARRGWVRLLRRLLRRLRYLLGPLLLPVHQRHFRRIVQTIQPDLVHALRIPFEGMLAQATPAGTPLILSIWGNDLTLHAAGSPWMGRLTRRVLRRADGLAADAGRDLQLALEWGFRAGRPTLLIPGSGGIRLERMQAEMEKAPPLPGMIPAGQWIVNPRGQRPGSLRQDLFLQAAALVLEREPQAVFICPGLAGEKALERLAAALNTRGRLLLWPGLAQGQLWMLLKQAAVYASPSLHDGTPNSLLEAMALGCLPVVGDVASLREWIEDGRNGLIADGARPDATAEALCRALADEGLRRRAKRENAKLITERAGHERCLKRAEAFYRRVLADGEN